MCPYGLTICRRCRHFPRHSRCLIQWKSRIVCTITDQGSANRSHASRAGRESDGSRLFGRTLKINIKRNANSSNCIYTGHSVEAIAFAFVELCLYTIANGSAKWTGCDPFSYDVASTILETDIRIVLWIKGSLIKSKFMYTRIYVMIIWSIKWLGLWWACAYTFGHIVNDNFRRDSFDLWMADVRRSNCLGHFNGY